MIANGKEESKEYLKHEQHLLNEQLSGPTVETNGLVQSVDFWPQKL